MDRCHNRPILGVYYRVLQEMILGMPKTETQEVRIMTASFNPGDRTVFHTHRFPVAVYILDGAYTLELEGRSPVRSGRKRPFSTRLF